MKYQLEHASPRTIYLSTGLFSLLLSLWAYLRVSIINPDGICYLEAARHVADFSLQSLLHFCDQSKWPFYSYLIYGFAKVTPFSLVHSAYLIDALFTGVTTISFVRIVAFATTKPTILWLAGFTLLFAQDLNGVREYIIRDHGFWCFYLVSIIALVRYLQYATLQHALLWAVSLVFAALFRIEASLFLLFIPPLVSIVNREPFRKKCIVFLQLNSLLLCGLVLMMVIHVSSHQSVDSTRLAELQHQLVYGFSILQSHLTETANALSHYVLNPAYQSQPLQMALIFIGAWYLQIIISSVSLLFTGFIIYAWVQRAHLRSPELSRVLWSYVAINVLLTTLFLVQAMFMSKRYVIALTLCLLIWAPFGIEAFAQRFKRKDRVYALIFWITLLVNNASLMNVSYSKSYLANAGQWLASHTHKTDRLYTNAEQVMYYAGRTGSDFFKIAHEFAPVSFLTIDKINQYDYLALQSTKNDLQQYGAVIRQLDALPVSVFFNSNHDEVRIYKVKHTGI
jgi:hypothetical protein